MICSFGSQIIIWIGFWSMSALPACPDPGLATPRGIYVVRPRSFGVLGLWYYNSMMNIMDMSARRLQESLEGRWLYRHLTDYSLAEAVYARGRARQATAYHRGWDMAKRPGGNFRV